MRVSEAAGAAEFLTRTYDVRAADPVRTNVLGSVATSVVEGRPYERAHWFVVDDDGGTAVAAAMWCLPYRLILAPMPDAAADALGQHLAGIGERPPGIIGPPPVVARVARAAGWETRLRMSERVLVLGEPVPAPPVPGAARPAEERDVALGTAWLRQFAIDTGTSLPDPEEAFRGRLGSAWLWEVDGVPLAYASHAALVGSPTGAVARVGPVFTVAEHRRRGYGSAVTWAVVDAVLPRASTVMLFTDAANPTSNGVYERLGFRVTAEVVDLDLV